MALIEYLLKFSLWIAVSWLFFRLFLVQLTFHNWKRYYLLIYGMLAFAVPFLDVAPWLNRSEANGLAFAKKIPPVDEYFVMKEIAWPGWTSMLLIVLGIGALIAVVRLCIQYIAFTRIRAASTLMHQQGGIRIYEVNEMKGAFSFANDIFINPSQHTHEELRRILLHEIVHVKQAHTLDLLMAEVICIVNWYNPFAWLLKRSVKQNLEYIADANVVASGADLTQYQYLLLKVTGMPQFHVGTHFNISDLKKRIAMMNKIKSAKLHMSRFLFAIPLLAVILMAFRSHQDVPANWPIRMADTVPTPEAEPVDEPVQQRAPERYNKKGYSLSVISTIGESIVLVRERNSKSVQAIPLDEWNRNKEQFEKKYGKLPPSPPPPPPAPPVPPTPPVPIEDDIQEPIPAPQPNPSVAPMPLKVQAQVRAVQQQVKQVNVHNELNIQHKLQVETKVNLQHEQVQLQNQQVQLQTEQLRLREAQINLQNEVKRIQDNQPQPPTRHKP